MQDFNSPEKSGRGSSGLETLGIMPEPKRSKLVAKTKLHQLMSLLPFEVLQVSRITMNRRYSWILYIYIYI
jgi:hypothetical protein